MVSGPLNVDRAQILDDVEATIGRRCVETRRRIDSRTGYLEQDATERIGDQLVVLVAEVLRQPVHQRAEPDLRQQARVAEGNVHRDRQLQLSAVERYLRDPLARERLQPRRRPSRRVGDRLQLSVHATVSTESDRGELIRESGVDRRVVAGVRGQVDAHCREELVVGDVLLLRADDASGDVEPCLLRERLRHHRRDPVVLAHEQRRQRRKADVLVRPHVAGDDRSLRPTGQRAHQIHRRRRERIGSACVPAREIAVDEHHLGVVVRHVAVEDTVPQPLLPCERAAVDIPSVDEAVDGVDLLARVRRAGTCPRRRRRPVELDRAEVVLERLERVAGLAGERSARILGGRFVPQAERVIDELPPEPTELRDAVLREQIHPEVVEDQVADGARIGSLQH